ncbi:hypothetical protein PARPLA_01265 [Rhodobacteraceae bacterium THAF1]|uniref:hypothetical protein n=1 Tax=Palleronia sp. THAF1 TaxID=2587842 RepID=UPI000F3EA652|nr:hypothetical protein [Palleronia sp. THAF1]QFU07216.1 hypothetical protein FIU81_00855 [Palleronia sp. THAF1]VDC20906.1 hypothetical protein PARPLA_01265 [Rhodobacteraceae bacterium THAF1]
MGLVRLLLVVVVTLSASVFGVMDAGHAAVVEHSHMTMDKATDDQPICCSESSERSPTCHVLPALLPGADLNDVAPTAWEDLQMGAVPLLTGIEPSGPLDPPRAV